MRQSLDSRQAMRRILFAAIAFISLGSSLEAQAWPEWLDRMRGNSPQPVQPANAQVSGTVSFSAGTAAQTPPAPSFTGKLTPLNDQARAVSWSELQKNTKPTSYYTSSGSPGVAPNGNMYVDMGGGKFGLVSRSAYEDCQKNPKACSSSSLLVTPVVVSSEDGKFSQEIGSTGNLQRLQSGGGRGTIFTEPSAVATGPASQAGSAPTGTVAGSSTPAAPGGSGLPVKSATESVTAVVPIETKTLSAKDLRDSKTIDMKDGRTQIELKSGQVISVDTAKLAACPGGNCEGGIQGDVLGAKTANRVIPLNRSGYDSVIGATPESPIPLDLAANRSGASAGVASAPVPERYTSDGKALYRWESDGALHTRAETPGVGGAGGSAKNGTGPGEAYVREDENGSTLGVLRSTKEDARGLDPEDTEFDKSTAKTVIKEQAVEDVRAWRTEDGRDYYTKEGEVYQQVGSKQVQTGTLHGDQNPAQVRDGQILSKGDARALTRVDNRKLENKKGEGWTPEKDVDEADGDCKYSNKIGVTCKGTRTLVKTAQITNQLTQMAGASAATINGQIANSKAAQEGTQEAVMRSAANQARMAGITNLSLGAMNIGVAAVQYGLSRKHKKEEANFRNAAKGTNAGEAGEHGDGTTAESQGGFIKASNDRGKDIDQAFGLNTARPISTDMSQAQCTTQAGKLICQNNRNEQFQSKQRWFNENMNTIGRKAAGEQGSVREEASNGALMSTLAGAPQLLTGAFAMMSAKQYEKAADELRRQANTAPVTPGFDPAPSNPNETPRSPFSDTSSSNATAAQDDVQPIDEGGAGPQTPGFDTGFGTNDGPQGGKDPGAYVIGKAQGDTGGGGGGGGLGGGSTREAQPDKEQGARPVSDENGRSFAMGEGQRGGGGGGKGGGGSDNGVDLSGLLAKFLPDAEKEHNNGKRMIAFDGDPAANSSSILGKEVNIFGRIHDAYQGKAKNGMVGI